MISNEFATTIYQKRQTFHQKIKEASRRNLESSRRYLRNEHAAEMFRHRKIKEKRNLKTAITVMPVLSFNSIAQIKLTEVAERYKLTTQEILCKGRTRRIVYPRNEAIYEIAIATKLSFPQIGKIFNKDHTTIIHGIRRHAELNGLPIPTKITRGMGCREAI